MLHTHFASTQPKRYSYRHQLVALAEQGFLGVAPDMRGYGGTEQPKEVEEYNVYRLAGDALSLVSHLGYSKVGYHFVPC